MKKLISLLLAFLLLFTNIGLLSSCASKASDCFLFEINTGGENCTLVGRHNCMETNLVIPDEFKGNPVYAIGEEAFCDFEALESIKIPKSIRVIDDCAFMGCTNLKTIYFSGTIKEWESIMMGFHSFYLVPAEKVICSDGTTKL